MIGAIAKQCGGERLKYRLGVKCLVQPWPLQGERERPMCVDQRAMPRISMRVFRSKARCSRRGRSSDGEKVVGRTLRLSDAAGVMLWMTS
eukprot:3482971-Rhodomonas_salina.1